MPSSSAPACKSNRGVGWGSFMNVSPHASMGHIHLSISTSCTYPRPFTAERQLPCSFCSGCRPAELSLYKKNENCCPLKALHVFCGHVPSLFELRKGARRLHEEALRESQPVQRFWCCVCRVEAPVSVFLAFSY